MSREIFGVGMVTSTAYHPVDAAYDPSLHADTTADDPPLRGPGCWPVIVMCVLAWAILGWLAYCAWLLFGNPVPIL